MQSSVRTCLGCHERKSPSELLRMVKTEDGIRFDTGKKQDGRGAYVCRNIACMKLLTKKHGLDRAFKKKISEDVYHRLQEEFEKFDQ